MSLGPQERSWRSRTIPELAQNASGLAETPPRRARIGIHMASRIDVHLPRISARATVQPTPILGSLIGLPVGIPRSLHKGSAASAARP